MTSHFLFHKETLRKYNLELFDISYWCNICRRIKPKYWCNRLIRPPSLFLPLEILINDWFPNVNQRWQKYFGIVSLHIHIPDNDHLNRVQLLKWYFIHSLLILQSNRSVRNAFKILFERLSMSQNVCLNNFSVISLFTFNV